MKYSYSIISFTVLLGTLLLFSYSGLNAQYPVGHPPGATAYGTMIVTPTCINTPQVKFPRFDPHEGMLTCVRLCISTTGVVGSEMSGNGVNFETFELLTKNTNGSVVYSSMMYNMTDGGRYFFRIRQVNDNSRSYFTNIKYIDAGSTKPIKFIVYPNPSMA
jgi:hypothetical protein